MNKNRLLFSVLLLLLQRPSLAEFVDQLDQASTQHLSLERLPGLDFDFRSRYFPLKLIAYSNFNYKF